MLRGVQLSRDVLWGCSHHALSTEHEEIMGLLLGAVSTDGQTHTETHTETQAQGVAYVTRWAPLARKVRMRDRVEVGCEDLAAAGEAAEQFSAADGSPCRVLGWYHSHPHITVFPSHVDVRTQGQYQQLDGHFLGLIFSVFDRSVNSVCAFQSVLHAEGWRRVDIPVWVLGPGPCPGPGPPGAAPRARLLDSLLSLQLEHISENFKSFLSAMGGPPSARPPLPLPPMAALQATAAASAALCALLHARAAQLLLGLRSKRHSMLMEQRRLRAALAALEGEGEGQGPCEREGEGEGGPLSRSGAGVVAAESSALFWKTSIAFTRIAAAGLSLRVRLPGGRVEPACRLRVLLACVSAAGGGPLPDSEVPGLRRAVAGAAGAARYSPWLVQYSPSSDPSSDSSSVPGLDAGQDAGRGGAAFALLLGVAFSDTAGAGAGAGAEEGAEEGYSWARLSVLPLDPAHIHTHTHTHTAHTHSAPQEAGAGAEAALTVLFDRAAEGDRHMETLFRAYFTSSFVSVADTTYRSRSSSSTDIGTGS
jgi:proteasome lid subunit RPN8/RPN11